MFFFLMRAIVPGQTHLNFEEGDLGEHVHRSSDEKVLDAPAAQHAPHEILISAQICKLFDFVFSFPGR